MTIDQFFELMQDGAIATLLVVGVGFCLLAAVGIARMPDVYTRMQAATKAGTVGVGCIVLATAFRFETFRATAEVLLVLFFLFVTTPIATHLLARAAYLSNARKWHGMDTDELDGCYCPETHALAGRPAEDAVAEARRLQFEEEARLEAIHARRDTRSSDA